MKKAVLIFLLLSLTGCAFFKTQKDNWAACKVDVTCFEKAKNYQLITENVSTVAASALPIPGAPLIPKALGYISFGLAMLIGGHALKKKEEKV